MHASPPRLHVSDFGGADATTGAMVKLIVKLAEVELKLTLTPKFLARSLNDAAIKPFLNAYNKKTGSAVSLDELSRIEADGVEVSKLACETAGFPAEIFSGELHRMRLTSPAAPEMALDASSAVEAVLGASNEFEVLGLRLEATGGAAVRRAYKRVSLAVHPDKVSHPRASEAFRRAFDAMKLLSDERSQARRLRQIESGDADGEGAVPSEARWWEKATVSEMEQAFHNLEEFFEAQGAFGADALDAHLWADPAEAERLRAQGLALFVDARDDTAYAGSHVAGALSLPGHTMEELQNLRAHPTVLQLARSPASVVVVYSDNGSGLSRCANVAAILRQTIAPERVRRLRTGLNGWKRARLPVDGDAREMFAGQVRGDQMLQSAANGVGGLALDRP